MKDDKQVIREFNKVVNMTADELDNWLKDSKSSQAGWSKEDGSGETVGHDSGRKITAILKSNPNKSPGKYTEDQIKHMRKVVAYCNRHLAQEKGSLDNKSTAEAKNSKSYISLKNWGHDPLKNQKERPDSNDDDTVTEKKKGQTEKTGGKRQQSSDNQDGASKRRETRQSAAKRRAMDEDEDDKDEKESSEEDENVQQKGKGRKAPKPGETVSWNWGQGQPKGKVLDVKEKDASITTKRGNKVSRKANSKDPAVILDTGKSKAIKSSHEINETTAKKQ